MARAEISPKNRASLWITRRQLQIFKTPMHCPFCAKTIDFKFLAGKWIATRDGQEHVCAGLIQALSGNAEPARQTAAAQTSIEPAPCTSTVTPGKTKLRSGLRKLPVQLELQALE